MSRSRPTFVSLIAMAFAAIGAPAAIAQRNEPSSPASEQGLGVDGMLDEAMAELLKPGPKRPDWHKGGVDLHSLIAAAPGGALQNYILTIDKAGSRSVTIVGGRGAADLLPPSWKQVIRVGRTPVGDIDSDLTVGHLDGPYYFAGSQGRRRVGDAYCSSGPMSGVLYRDQDSDAATQLPEAMLKAVFEQMFARFESMTACWRYDRDGEFFRTSSFLEDGTSLPVLDETIGERLRIVPADSLAKLLAQPAPKSE